MYPSQVQLTIELLDQMTLSPLPVDSVAKQFFRRRRFIGSKDRKIVSDFTYQLLRNNDQLIWWAQKTGLRHHSARSHVLLGLLAFSKSQHKNAEKLFTGRKYEPAELSESEKKALSHFQESQFDHPDMPEHIRLNLPQWIYELLKCEYGDNTCDHIEALNKPATLDLRVNTIQANRSNVMRQFDVFGWKAQETAYSPHGIRLERGSPLSQSDLFKNGLVEIQDESSQIAAILCDAKPGMMVLDLCAGAGGKSLALAASMQNKGRLVLTDTSAFRLSKAKERLRRAGISNHDVRFLDSEGQKWLKRQANRFDRVVADVPCSGSGTWRRNPDLKRRFQPKDLEELQKKQQEILTAASSLVKPGGHLIYSTCSLLAQEDEHQIQKFITQNPQFELIPISRLWQELLASEYPGKGEMLKLTPLEHQTDGFFIAVMKRKE